MYILPEQKNKYIEDMINKYSDLVYRLAITRCKSVENAEDIFQDVFFIFNKKMPSFESEEHEKAWFIRVTINCSKNFINSSWNKKTTSLDENIEFNTKEKHDVFYEVLKLPKKYKTVIYLHYYEGYKISEISNLMKQKEATVKTWMLRARKILEKNLKGGFEDE